MKPNKNLVKDGMVEIPINVCAKLNLSREEEGGSMKKNDTWCV